MISRGAVTHFPLARGQEVLLKIEPLDRQIDVGAGRGQTLERKITAGECGLVFDGRGRPIPQPANSIAEQREIMGNLGLLAREH